MAVVDVACRRLLTENAEKGGWLIVFDISSPLFQRCSPLGKVIYVPKPLSTAESRLLDQIRFESRYGVA